MKRLCAIAATIVLASAGAAFAAPKGPPAPSAYAGKSVSDKVGGYSFLDNPKVRAAIDAAVPAGEIRDLIYGDSVVGVVIPTKGRLLLRGYEPASGGDVNWTVLIVADGSKAAVCYSTGVVPNVQGADWYLAGEKVLTNYARCPGEAKEVEDTLGTWPIGSVPG